MSTTQVSRNRAGAFLISEANGTLSREKITLTGGLFLPGEVLGKVTADGKYTKLDPAATDGSENAAGVHYGTVEATTADADGVAFVRFCEIDAAALIWPDGITGGEKTAALADLKALNVIVR